jgi:hypothetical protein
MWRLIKWINLTQKYIQHFGQYKQKAFGKKTMMPILLKFLIVRITNRHIC